jgi:hypothetical protein
MEKKHRESSNAALVADLQTVITEAREHIRGVIKREMDELRRMMSILSSEKCRHETVFPIESNDAAKEQDTYQQRKRWFGKDSK